jgi:hypothetical protein
MRIFELLEDNDNYYIASELLSGGELYDRIVKMKHFNEINAAFLIYQVLLAISYMHTRNIIHRYESFFMKSDKLKIFCIGILNQRIFCSKVKMKII